MNKWCFLIMSLLFITVLPGCNNGSAKANPTDIISTAVTSTYIKQIIPSSQRRMSAGELDIVKKNSYIQPDGENWLKSVCFLSSKVGFLSVVKPSSVNALMKSEDGGHTWRTVNSSNDLYALSFVTNKIGYAVDNLGDGNNRQPTLVKTIDGGVNWYIVPFVKNKIPVEINCIDENTVIIGASTETNGLLGGLKYEDSVFISKDGAKSWQTVQTPKEFYGEGISWISPEEGYLMHTEQPGMGMQPKTLYHTTNGGKTWVIIAKSDAMGEEHSPKNALPLIGCPNGIKFFKDGTGYVGSIRGVVLKTTDKGKTFKSFNHPGGDDKPVPNFINKDEGFIILDNRKLTHTIDGGESWNTIWP